ncbi:cell envelope integrity protein TolA [Methylobacterium sp. Leaf88]|uniref:cell envelope integrity protein TolA n=1 Tax=Methylobacterium sp. Leaf88 TaxID=1736244 RepID=UPI0007009BA5|nr:cell envelope integrity protein TolA [Methylobacterium sp. Leaf88]KQO69996.1 protein TolA [Methylobacterium sp. Leaf88]
MRIPFKRSEPGVWVSAATHVGLLTVALLSVAAPALPDAQEGVPVEVMTEQQYSELTKGERNADAPQPNAKPRADRVAEKFEEREPENAKVDAPAPPKRPADMKVASAEEMPLRSSEPDPQDAKAEAAKAEAAKAEAAEKAAKADAAKAAAAAEAKAAAAAEAKAAAAAEAKAAAAAEAKAAAAEAKAAAAAKAKAEAVKREQLAELIEKQEAEAEAKAEAAAKVEAAKAEAKAEAARKARAEAKAKADAEAKAEKEAEAKAKAVAEAKAKAEAERQKELAEAKAEADAEAKAEAAAKAKAEAAAKAKAKAMADAKAKADGEAKAKKQAELADKFSAGDIRSLLASKAPSQSTGATGREVQRTASLGAASGNAQRLSPSLRDALVGMLQQQIERCYVAPPGATQGVVLPMLDIRLNPDGTLTSEPRIMRGGANAVDRSIAEAAQRAVRRCAPYKIPAQYAPYYNDWKAINAEFEFSRV